MTDDCIENRDCEDGGYWFKPFVPPPQPWYKRLYYWAGDRVWRIRYKTAQKIAGCHFDCW